MRGYSLGPQQVTLAGLAICNSDDDVHCGLSIIPADRAPETIAATDDLPLRVDWLQHELHQGPCVGADCGELLVSKDLAADQRWPDFGKMCVAVMNVRSMVSIKVWVPWPDRARLSFYSSEATAFDHLDVDAALRLARIAAPMVRVLIGEFGEALLGAAPGDYSRVAVAVGTVIARYKVTSAEAFDLLRDASHDLHRTLLGVAIDVVADGRLPEGAIGHVRPHCRPARLRGTGDPRDQHPWAHGESSIGGPDMWHEPSAAETGETWTR
ncbi:MAG TPA: ANTAR domain-containing protein [Propionicimonas sp.]|uniref:ANTAR domain-containing protein n=1 Tax=Propionicimonas sp. TaxID=1955623 RepID=UPI002F40353F